MIKRFYLSYFLLLLPILSCNAMHKTVAPDTSIIAADDTATYSAARMIAGLVVSYAGQVKDFTFKDISLSASIDPTKVRVSQGIEIGVFDGMPMYVYTKWGRWNFITDVVNNPNKRKQVLKHLLAHVTPDCIPLNKYAYTIPVAKVDDIVVPHAKIALFVSNDLEKQTNRSEQWRKLTIKHYEKPRLKARL